VSNTKAVFVREGAVHRAFDHAIGVFEVDGAEV
jgi:hypothetical protein